METALDRASFRLALEETLEIPKPMDEIAKKYKQPYAFFTPQGAPLEQLSEMVDNIVFLFEGGQFIWPGVKIGHKSESCFSVGGTRRRAHEPCCRL